MNPTPLRRHVSFTHFLQRPSPHRVLCSQPAPKRAPPPILGGSQGSEETLPLE